MKITPSCYNNTRSQQANKQNNKQSFGMDLSFANQAARHKFFQLVPSDIIEILNPAILAIRTASGKAITGVIHELDENSVRIAVSAGGKVVDGILSCLFGKSTAETKKGQWTWESLIPTLEYCEKELN